MNNISKIILVEPSAIVVRGIKDMLAGNKEFEIVGTLPDFSHCSDRIQLLSPQILILNPIVLDYTKRSGVRNLSPNMQRLSLVAINYSCLEEEQLKQYDTVINIFDDQSTIIKKLRHALEQNKSSGSVSSEVNELSDREKEILISVAQGMINKEIADMHNISIHTVISHRKNITRKTGIKTVSGLTLYALLNNLISMSELD